MSMRVSLITLGDPQTLTGGYLYHRRLASLAPENDAELSFFSVPVRRFPWSVFSGRGVLTRARAASDVVVCDSIASAFVAPALSRAAPVPVAAMLHQPPGGIDHGRVRRLVQRRLDLRAYRRMDRLLVASETLRDDLVSRGFAPDHVEVVAPGRDAPRVSDPGTPEDLRRGRRVAFLCVGNWVPRKQIVELLDAFGRLPDGVATLHLVGDDRADADYAARVRDVLAGDRLRERVVVHGSVSRDRVDDLYRSADVFVLPSVSEPYGTVYGEALAAGLPAVGWRAGNLPHLIRHGREGLLVEPGDVRRLAAAMREIALDDGMRDEMSRRAYERGRRLPTWADTARAFFGALRALVESRDGGRPAGGPMTNSHLAEPVD